MKINLIRRLNKYEKSYQYQYFFNICIIECLTYIIIWDIIYYGDNSFNSGY